MPRRFPAAALALAIACVSFTTAVAIASLPRRLAAGLEPSADVAIREQFPCDPLPLGGTAPPGIKSICYYINVPLNYSAPASGNLTVFVRRTFLDSPGRGDLLWMLPGGSGVPSWSETSIAAPLVYGLASINQTFDVLMMDKRGTGNSRCVGAPLALVAHWAVSTKLVLTLARGLILLQLHRVPVSYAHRIRLLLRLPCFQRQCTAHFQQRHLHQHRAGHQKHRRRADGLDQPPRGIRHGQLQRGVPRATVHDASTGPSGCHHPGRTAAA